MSGIRETLRRWRACFDRCVVSPHALSNSELLSAIAHAVNTPRARYDSASRPMEQTTELSDVFIFANTIAGRGRGKLVADRLQQAVGNAGYRVRTFFDLGRHHRPRRLPRRDAPAGGHRDWRV